MIVGVAVAHVLVVGEEARLDPCEEAWELELAGLVGNVAGLRIVEAGVYGDVVPLVITQL